jgi:hypothetical protein
MQAYQQGPTDLMSGRTTPTIIILIIVLTWLGLAPAVSARAQTKRRGVKRVPNRIPLANGKAFNLNLPEGFGISVAAQGLKRVRFMAKSPDERIFVTDRSPTSKVQRPRPVDILSFGINGFLLTDDYAGVVYYVYEK